MKYKATDQQFEEAVKNSGSIRECLTLLGMRCTGNNYTFFHKRVERLNLDTSHFHGQLWSKGKKLGSKKPIEHYLNNKTFIHSHELRLRLIKERFKEERCELCKNTHWLSEPIPLELHHIDGNHKNNALENLQVLCPSCHAVITRYQS